MKAPAWIRGMRAAVVFLTRVPVGGFPYSRDDWRWSSAHFPMVGMLLGIVLALPAGALVPRAGAWVTAALVVAGAMLLTGAFHEDGLADTADALGGAYDREKLFVILKDSRVGSFGAAALGIVLLLRVCLLARLEVTATALIVSQCLARTPPIWLMAALPYVSHDAAAKSRTVARGGLVQASVASAWAALAMGCAIARGTLGLGQAWWCITAMVLSAVICGWRFSVRAGGITGDFLGATEQVCECAVLLAMVCTTGARPA